MSGFVTIVIKAFLKLSHEDTIFITNERGNEFRLPTITICPVVSNLSLSAFAQDKTFEDLYENIETSKQYYSASVAENGWDTTDLTNATELKENYGAEINNVWTFSPRMDHSAPILSVCASITPPPFGKVSDTNLIFLMINITQHGQTPMYFVEKRNKGHSRHNSQYDWGAGIELINPGLFRLRRLTMGSINRIKTQRYDCDETNSQLCEDSTNQYIMDQLNCKPKWMKYNTSLATCSGKEKLIEYLELAYNMSKSLINHICIQPNCQSSSWGLENDENIEAFQTLGQTTLAYFVTSHTKVSSLV